MILEHPTNEQQRAQRGSPVRAYLGLVCKQAVEAGERIPYAMNLALGGWKTCKHSRPHASDAKA
jgi:hypothetical protein